MKIKRRPMPAPHIPFISLADIAWQIIIFFFMAASFTKLAAMKMNPPSATADASKSQQQDKITTVVAKPEGITLDGAATTIDQLASEISLKLKDKIKAEDRVVVVEGNKGLTWQKNVEVLYAIRKAGGTPVESAPDEGAGGH
jgi:biopolymer transport protein ExbD